jgi:methyl-accepting chemotaxis protein
MASEMTDDTTLTFSRRRMQRILAELEAYAAGDLHNAMPLSPDGDELDAIAHAVNVLADQLREARRRNSNP